jgi:site-specific recombinase XerD
MFKDFVKELRYLRNVSPLTIKCYRQAYDRYLKFGKALPPTEQSLKDFIIGMRSAGLSSTSCNISIRAMNSYLSWLKESGHIREPLRIKQVKEEKRVKQGYSDAELSVLLSIKPRSFYEWRLFALLCTLVDTGCRIDELLSGVHPLSETRS